MSVQNIVPLKTETERYRPQSAAIRSPIAGLPAEGGVVLYGRDGGAPLRMMVGVSLVCTLASLWLALSLILERRLVHHPNEASLLQSRSIALFITASVFGLLSFALWNYARTVISRIVLMPGSRSLRLTSLAVAGTRDHKVPLSELSILMPHRGDCAGEESFSGPWLHILVRHERTMLLPLSGPRDEMEKLVALLTNLCALQAQSTKPSRWRP